MGGGWGDIAIVAGPNPYQTGAATQYPRWMLLIVCGQRIQGSISILGMEITKLIGRNLRAYRLRRQWSQEDLAVASGVHRTYISGLERGVRNPSVIIVGRLATALGIEPGALFKKDICP